MLRVLTLSTLFPDATRPNFGIFVERQTRALAALPDTEVRVVAPVGIPPFPLDRARHYRSLATLPHHETWRGLDVARPRFLNLPATGGRFHAMMLSRALHPVLKRLRRDFPFDVIDAEFFFPDGPAAIWLGRRFGVPVSIKARGADIHFWGRNRTTATQVRDAGNAAHNLLAVSQALADDMAATGITRPVSVHRTGIDHDRFHPAVPAIARAALGVTGPLVVSVGALVARKGHDILVDAVASLPGVSLLIAGEGPERASLAAQIRARGVPDRVSLLGAVAHDGLPGLYAAADVMALASASEGLANAWVEALACGTPIVVTDAGGARELVDRPAAGRIVPRTPAAFAAAIAELISAPPGPREVAETVGAYDWQTNATSLRTMLAACVANSMSPQTRAK